MTNWIKCSYQQPQKDDRYLVVERHARLKYEWIGVCSLRNGKWDSDRIIYWAELPEAPKDE